MTIALFCATAGKLDAHEGWGIVVDAHERVYVADIPANTIWRISPDGRTEPIVRGVHSHALALGFDGFVYGTDVAISGSSRTVWRLDMTGGLSDLRAPGSEHALDLQPFLIAKNGDVYSISRYEPKPPADGRSLYLLRRNHMGGVDTLAGGKVGYADGVGRAARFSGIDGMAWLPDGRIALVDGARIRAMATDGSVSTLSGELTRQQWDQDLMGLFVSVDGQILVADFAQRRLLQLVNGRTRTVFSSGFFWSPTGVTQTANGIYLLEHLRAPLGILGDLKIGPYLQVRRIADDRRTVVLSRAWGANSAVALSVTGVMVAFILVIRGARARSRRNGIRST
ncbi:MAG: hypothetical protein WKF55_01525 [Gemmatimonadaceae bacterium]